MAEKRYVEVAGYGKIESIEYVVRTPTGTLRPYIGNPNAFTFSDILKQEIKDGSLKGLREKVKMTAFTIISDMRNLREAEQLKKYGSTSSACAIADAILTLLQGKE